MNKVHLARKEDTQRVALPGGATLLTQVVPSALSVSIGIWVRSGSRDEAPAEHGITHFLEHMVFKGTKTRSALDIALSMDRLGGQLDAFTTKELTCFNVRVLAEYFDASLELLSDLIANPVLDESMIETEKEVVVNEIRNVFDDPDDLIHDFASDEILSPHPLGRPILGTEESVSSFTRDDLRAYLQQRYTAGNIIVAVAGPLEHARVQERVEALFEFRHGMPGARGVVEMAPVEKRLRVETRDLMQQHLWIGRRGMSSRNPDRYGMLLLSTILGGSMSSRLFQTIREQAGLAYNVYTFSDFASDTGLVGTYMAVSPSRSDEAIKRTQDQFVLLIADGCREQELEDTKMQLKGNLLMAMESISARMSRLARNEMTEGRFIGIEELVRRIDAVTVADIQRLAADYLDPDAQTLVSLGPNTATGTF